MATPRQPIDSEREDLTKNRIEDLPSREAGSLELDDEDIDMSEDDFDDVDDIDY